MNLLLQDAMEPGEVIRPRCYNRPPIVPEHTRHGIDSETGKPIAVTLRNDWFVDRCVAWSGVGIGQPTAEYPSGTPYPMARGWDCAGCRWNPEGTP